jgi:FtsZ-binding cell division protein ZapB
MPNDKEFVISINTTHKLDAEELKKKISEKARLYQPANHAAEQVDALEKKIVELQDDKREWLFWLCSIIVFLITLLIFAGNHYHPLFIWAIVPIEVITFFSFSRKCKIEYVEWGVLRAKEMFSWIKGKI